MTTIGSNYSVPYGDRLDIALWSAKVCVVASYVKADEWSIIAAGK